MTKIKTSELTGDALAWAVAKCEGHAVYRRHDFIKARVKYLNHDGGTLPWHLSQQTNDPIVGILETGETKFLPRYATDWAQGGPIIERGKFDIEWIGAERCRATYCWLDEPFYEGFGSTPLSAAMRCYVASKLGDEVDVPEELI